MSFSKGWRPRRVLIAANFTGLPEYLQARRSDLEWRAVKFADMTADDVAWADTFVGSRPPAIGQWGSIRWIHGMGAGMDAIVRGNLTPGIVVTRSSEDFGPAIAEWCLTRALAFNQHLRVLEASQAQREWAARHHDVDPIRIAGQRVLILGTGLVGRGIARAFTAVGCSVTGLSRSGRPTPDFGTVRPAAGFVEAVKGAQWLVLAAPLADETHHFLNRDRMQQCGGTYLLNVGRGKLADEAALPAAIDQGWLSGAALDVFATEPLAADSPLWLHPKIVISPHNSGPSTIEATGDGFLECLAQIERGEQPRWIVDPAKGY